MAIFKDIQTAVTLLKRGELVGLPTETVYGLGGNALDVNVVAKIFEAKNRPSFDPLIVHVPSLSSVEHIAHLNDEATVLFERFSPGPLTIVLKKKDCIPDLVTSGHSTVAVRIPNHPMTLAVLEQSGLCIAAPSANPFGFTSPTTAAHVERQLGDQIGGVLDGGSCKVGLESTIIDASGEELRILRLGGLAYEELAEVIGYDIPIQTSSSKPNAPGMLSSHYNPGKVVRLFDTAEDMWKSYYDRQNDRAVGLLYTGETKDVTHGLNLSSRSDLAEVAAGLFAGLRSFSELPVDEVWTYKMPEQGLGRAINDRLKRAAVKAQK